LGGAGVKIESLPLSKLKPAAYNPRTITDEAMARLEASTAEFGLVEPLVVNKRTGWTVVGGHQRLKLLQKRGVKSVECVVVDLPLSREKALNVALNNQAMAGTYDFSKLADLLQGIDTGEFDVSALTGFDAAELERIANWTPGAAEEDPAPLPETPKKPLSRCGDLWALGAHRVMCGDSTSEVDVKALLDGTRPQIMVTDPPYGVEYEADWRNAAGLSSSKQVGKVANDDRASWASAFRFFTGDVAYVWHAAKFASVVERSLVVSGLETRSQIVWVKKRFAISRGNYHWRHEPCWYAVRKGSTATWSGGRRQSTVWADIVDAPAVQRSDLFAVKIDDETVLAFNGSDTTVWEISHDPAAGGGAQHTEAGGVHGAADAEPREGRRLRVRAFPWLRDHCHRCRAVEPKVPGDGDHAGLRRRRGEAVGELHGQEGQEPYEEGR
jgi:ParB-like nuclease family protein